MNQRIEDFLYIATEGLQEDIELQLDTRAELTAHAEEKFKELIAENMPADEAAEQVVKSLGDPLALAEDLYDANRRRMNIRAQLRFFARFALVPLAILSMVWSNGFGIPLNVFPGYTSVLELKTPDNLTEQEILILRGDPSRSTYAEQQKAIWESEPTHKIYFANYFNQVADAFHDGENPIPVDLLKMGREIDPDNALYLYIEAYQVLNPVGENRPALQLNKTPNRSEISDERLDYEILDRERLDRGMALIETALKKPYSKHYSGDMLNIRLGLIPSPQTMSDQIARIGLSAGSFHFPFSLSQIRKTSAMLSAYGDALLEEGKVERADTFLNAWKPLSQQTADSADTLIEVLIAASITSLGDNSATVYEYFGYMGKAEWMRKQTAIAQAPREEFQSLRKTARENTVLKNRGSLLAQIGIPSVPNYGPPLTAEDCEPSRRLELTIFTRMIISFISWMMIAVITICGLSGLHRRFFNTAHIIPILLLPDILPFIKLLAQSVLLPGIIFLAITRLVPWSGHEFNVFVGLHKIIIEFTLLGLSLLSLPALLGARRIRIRCEELGIPVDKPRGHRVLYAIGGGTIVLFLLWLLPVNTQDWVVITTGAISAVLLLALLLLGIGRVVRGYTAGKEYALFYGTCFRSLIPLYAVALLVLNLTSRPLLRVSEAKYIQQDTLFCIAEDGITSVETSATRHIRQRLLDALEKVEDQP